ncbi:MAG: hypothetical protein NT010_01540 [Proteobacteria bacterium]|nr:hypothetical protein [Pseudomonadota bacterium]
MLFGYRATDNITPGFVDISGSGTQVLAGVDDEIAFVQVGVNFKFYGQTYNSVYASSNGLITFGLGNSECLNSSLTSTDWIGHAVAVLWSDWATHFPGSVYYKTVGTQGSQQFIVQWNQVMGHSSSPKNITFQGILFEGSNSILFNYANMKTGDGRADGGTATVGLAKEGTKIVVGTEPIFMPDPNWSTPEDPQVCEQDPSRCIQPVIQVGEQPTYNYVDKDPLEWSYNNAIIGDNYSIIYSTVPIPGAIWLLAPGLVGLIGLKRKYLG